jgi:hypothetical protein
VSTFRGKVRQADRTLASVRAQHADGALRNVDLCGRKLESLQLMRKSLCDANQHPLSEGHSYCARVYDFQS